MFLLQVYLASNVGSGAKPGMKVKGSPSSPLEISPPPTSLYCLAIRTNTVSVSWDWGLQEVLKGLLDNFSAFKEEQIIPNVLNIPCLQIAFL